MKDNKVGITRRFSAACIIALTSMHQDKCTGIKIENRTIHD